MKHLLSVLALGLAAALAAHFGWFQLHRPCSGSQLDCQLSWIKSELQLNDAQFTRIKAIHEASSPRLLALAMQVSHMREEYAAFERQRVANDRVDFLEFARFVEQRRTIDNECLASTRLLVNATSDVMTPEQRKRYLGLLGPALGPQPKSAAN